MIRVFLLLFASLLAASAQVKLTPKQDRITIEIAGKPFSEYFFAGENLTKPYLHPLRAASGKIVTRRYPMEMVEGEKRDHQHHRGLWFTHGEVNDWDFWANETTQKGVGKGRGKVVTTSTKAKKDTIEANAEWIAGDGTKLLTEARKMKFSGTDMLRIIDVDITLTAVTKSVFGDTKEGTFALRVARELEEDTQTGTLTNAEGKKKQKEVWGKQSAWCDYAGTLEGEKLGITIIDHPKNPRHPTYWHARGYGLFAANPFGVRDFTGDKTKDGALTLEPGQSLRFRYRVVIHPGATDAAQINGWAAKFGK
ncbi:MAG: PmoA family protein [Bryobacter sp.]|jgi:hypothetical protein|nr:PmoA family protein [Bryobacter sp.]